MTDWIGSTLSKVQIEKLLSRGGMAEVYLGRHTTLNRVVAVKILHSYLTDDPTLSERFRAEAQGVATLRHPNIVQVYDFDIANDQPYIVMEALDGPTLAEYLRVLHAGGGRLPLHAVSRFISTLASALDYAHTRGIIHRDIKPANVILRSEGGRPIPRPPKMLPDDVMPVLTDFGLARMVNTTLVSSSGTITGTPAYMSPEQARSDKVGSYSDIYSLGVVLYEMVAGQPPFRGDTPARLIFEHISQPPPPLRRGREDVPEGVESVVLKALAKNPDDRHESVGELAAALAEALSQTLILGPTLTPVERRHAAQTFGPVLLHRAVDTFRRDDSSMITPPARPAAAPAAAPPRRSRPGLTLAALIFGSLIVGGLSLALMSGQANRFPTVAATLANASSTPPASTEAIGVPSETAQPGATAPPVATAPPTGGPMPTVTQTEAPTETLRPGPTLVPTVPATPANPFVDDFSRQLGGEWTVVRGNVGVVVGRLTLRDVGANEAGDGLALVSNLQWRDMAIEAPVQNIAATDLTRFLEAGNAAAALLLHTTPDGAGLGLVIERAAVQFALLDADGNWTLLTGTRASKGVIFDAGRVVRVEARGDRYRAFVGGDEVTSVEYHGPAIGQAGVWFRSIVVNGAAGQIAPQIERISVQRLPPPQTPSAPSGLPGAFVDNFDAGLRPEWRIVSGGWGMAKDRLTFTQLLASEASTGLIAVNGSQWANAQIQATITDLFDVSEDNFLFEGNSAVGLLLRMQPDGSGVGVVVERHALTLATRDAAGNWTPLPNARFTRVDFDTPHSVQLRATGGTYTVYLDRGQVLSAAYPDGPTDGGAGVWMRSAIPINPADRTVVPKLDDFRASGLP